MIAMNSGSNDCSRIRPMSTSDLISPTAGYFEDAGLALVAGREGDRFLIFGRDHTLAPPTGDPVPAP